MANVWLQVRPCSDVVDSVGEDSGEGDAQGNGKVWLLDTETVLRLPALSEAMKVAENASDQIQREGAKYWEYSVRLTENEVGEMADIFSEGIDSEEAEASLRTVKAKHSGRCYELALFVFKE